MKKALSYKVIENQEGLKELAGRLSCEDSFAIDIEADSLHNYEGKVCLIQISTKEENYIIDVLKLQDLEPLRPLLFDDRIEKVLHGADYDIRMLAKDYGMEIRNLFDTMIAGQILGLKGLGLAALLNDYFKVNIDKGLQKADWSKRPLSKEMLSYAALDTAHLLGLRDLLASKLEIKGRMEWAREEFHLLSLNRAKPRQPVSVLTVKGVRDLNGRQLAVLQALLEFRDAEARELDRPPFKVLGSDLLIDIAKAHPSTLEGLRNIRGVTERVVERYGKRVLEAIKKGNSVPSEQCPRFEKVERSRRSDAELQRFDRLKAVSARIANELAIDPAILCTNASLSAIASATPETFEETMRVTLKSWQRDLLGREFLAVFE